MKTFNKLILSLFLCFLFIGANAQTIVSQVISANETWTASGSPYIVNQNILIKPGATVKVMPGTKIRGTGDFKIIIEGGFEASGKKDSVIRMDSIKFEYRTGSVGYNFTTKKGASFNYCNFNGTGVGGLQTIALFQVSLMVSNCRFINTYYTIYVVNSNFVNMKIRIEKSIFEGGKDYGYVISSMGTLTELEMDECVVKKMYGALLSGSSTITRCLFYDWVSNGGFNLNWSTKAIFKCNTFRKFRSSIIDFTTGNKATTEIIIVSNTFDSADYHIKYMVGGDPCKKFVCKNNNFLHYNKNSIQVTGGSTPGFADTLVFTKNYWNTADPTKIAKGIWDITDDIAVAGLVDYANYNASINTNCIEEESEESFVGGSGSNGVKRLSNSGFSIYPNPANSFVTIQSINGALKSWKIYNITGELLKDGDFNSQNQLIDISGLSHGFFFIEVGDGQTFSGKQKLVISR